MMRWLHALVVWDASLFAIAPDGRVNDSIERFDEVGHKWQILEGVTLPVKLSEVAAVVYFE